MDNKTLLHQVVILTEKVAAAILPIYQKQTEIALTLKDDGSPLTEADIVANQIIQDGLAQLTPDIPVLSEESCDIPYAERLHWQRYWIVDPIDGTKEFLEGNGEFTINIALIEHHQAILGVVNAPVFNQIYFADKSLGAFKKEGEHAEIAIQTRQFIKGTPLHLIASRRHGKEQFSNLEKHFKPIEFVHCGSSLKFCLVAEGKVDLYPRFGLTSEWDTAAAQCIVEAAGGKVVDLNGFPLQYNTRDSYQNPYFVAIGDGQVDWLQYLKL